MKTAEEFIDWIINDMTSVINPIELLIRHVKDFERYTRKDERENRIKKLSSMGEFKTDAEAKEYCRLHGLDFHTTIGNVFRIAGALKDARKDELKKIPTKAIKGALWWLSDGLDNADMNNIEQQITIKFKEELEKYLSEIK